MLSASQLQFDKEHVWHPYTSLTGPLPVYVARSAQGVFIELEDGRVLVDGMSSWWCTIHGYGHPKLVMAAQQQAAELSHVMFGGLTHAPAIELCQKLVEMTPAGLEKVFLCDSGSVSVEVALKMALQYWQARGKTGKNKMLALRKGYHGDTLGAMSVCDPDDGMHRLFAATLPKQLFVGPPRSSFGEGLHEQDELELVQIFEKHHHEMAAFILEPIVQGAGGMRFYSAEYLKKVRILCDQYGVLLIADEIATGFGRTGKLFAMEHVEHTPDILCLGKALTGGMLSLAATLCTDEVSKGIGQSATGVFMHGPTFMGNPLACKVAMASLEILATYNLQQKIGNIEKTLREALIPLSNHHRVTDVRVLGGIGVVECGAQVEVGTIQRFYLERGVWIRPFRNLIYVMPPYTINSEQLQILCSAIADSLEHDIHFKQ